MAAYLDADLGFANGSPVCGRGSRSEVLRSGERRMVCAPRLNTSNCRVSFALRPGDNLTTLAPRGLITNRRASIRDECFAGLVPVRAFCRFISAQQARGRHLDDRLLRFGFVCEFQLHRPPSQLMSFPARSRRRACAGACSIRVLDRVRRQSRPGLVDDIALAVGDVISPTLPGRDATLQCHSHRAKQREAAVIVAGVPALSTR